MNGKKVSIFQIVADIKRELKVILPNTDGSRLIIMFSHCRRHYQGKLHYGRRDSPNKRPRELSADERVLYEFLLKNKLNPCTTYRWFIATRVPDDIKEKLEKGQIGQIKAMQIAANRRRVKESNKGLMMMEEIRTIIGCL